MRFGTKAILSKGSTGAWLATMLLVHLPSSAAAQALYFSSGASIESAALDGTDRHPFVSVSDADNSLIDLTVDPVTQTLYWALYAAGSNEAIFYSANPKDKQPQEIFRKSGGDFRSIAVDGVAGRIYWARTGNTSAIQRADLDGENVETIVTPIGIGLFDLVVYTEADELYWTSTTVYGQQGTIHRATLSGADEDSLITGQGWPSGICVDRQSGWLYWSDNFWNAVKRARLTDGSDIQTVVAGIGEPVGIAVDPGAGKLYWVDTMANKVQWADLDGQNVSDLLPVASPERLDVLLGDQVGVAPATWSDMRRRYR